MKILGRLVLSIGLVGITSCQLTNGYSGDGTIVDRGFWLYAHRYEIVLGTVDLSSAGKVHFRASGLPDRRFVLGLRVRDASCSATRSHTQVTLTVTNERGERVIHETAPLSELIWADALDSHCQPGFGYVRSRGVEKKLPNGDVCMKPILTGADEASGSYFNPHRDGKYEIEVTVLASSVGLPLAEVVLDDSGSPGKSDTGCYVDSTSRQSTTTTSAITTRASGGMWRAIRLD